MSAALMYFTWVRQHGRRASENRSPRSRLWAARENARRRGIEWRLSDEEALALLDGTQECFWCGARAYGIDRLDASRGYVSENVAPSCWPCNRARGATLSREEFLKLARRIVVKHAAELRTM